MSKLEMLLAVVILLLLVCFAVFFFMALEIGDWSCKKERLSLCFLLDKEVLKLGMFMAIVMAALVILRQGNE